jgi:raffinose/stachyose/melibiose transport system permease protein
MNKKHKARSLYSYKLLVPALVLYCAFFVLPTIMGFGYSFTDWRLDRPAIHFNGLKNFTRIFHDKVIVLAFWNTIEFTALTVLMKNGFGLILASLLNRKIRSRNLLRGIFYLPSILSAVAVGVVFTAMLYPEGPLNSFLRQIGLGILAKNWLDSKEMVMYSISGVAAWTGIGFHMTIYLSGYQSISNDFYEAAKIDGATDFQCFTKISIPMLRAVINMNLMLSIIAGLKVFTEVFIMTNGGPGNSSQVLSTMVYKYFGNGNWGLGTAMNTELFLLVAIVTIPLLIFIRKGEVEA